MRRSDDPAEQWLRVDRTSPKPLAEQIYAAVSARIARGSLRAGCRLPSTRHLSRLLGVSRTTVTTAFDLLMAEGLVCGHVGSGTYVAPARRMSDDVAQARPAALPDAREQDDGSLVLNPGPALDHFPFDIWQSLAAEIVPQMRQLSAGGEAAGYAPLREAIAEFTRRQRGIACSPDQVIVTQGATQAFDMIVRTLARAGDLVMIEDPSEPRVAGTLERAGVACGVAPVDDQGLDISAVSPGGRGRVPRLIHVTPVRQFPLGTSLSPQREADLRRAAQQSGAWIVEWDSTLTVQPPRQPLLAGQAVDDCGIVYYTSLSWVLYRALRMGYIIAPRRLMPALIATRQFMDVHPPVIEQAILARFIGRGHMVRYIEKMRAVNEVRRQALIDAWPGAVVPDARFVATSGGLGNVLLLPSHIDDAMIARTAERQGVFPVPISSWYHGRSQPGLYVGYGRHDPRRNVQALHRLAHIVHAQLNNVSDG